MRSGEDGRDIIQLEKKAGQKAARTIRRNLKAILGTATQKQSGELLRLATATATMKFESLESITIKATPATFKQHYGFEGIKSNGVYMKMKAFDHFTLLQEKSQGALERLIDEIGSLRAEEITSKIKF
ncbi:hypothetical protein [Flagellimonas sp.]|uniref:hypothetical protein n=1 Tax=Flagellimonas sp. TaxID=2058762 RepID=UPI003BABE117